MSDKLNICCNRRDKGMQEIDGAIAQIQIRSALGMEYTQGQFNYCPYCGTKIERKKEDGNT